MYFNSSEIDDLINEYFFNMAVEQSLSSDEHQTTNQANTITQEYINQHYPLVYIESNKECSICLKYVETGSRMRKFPCDHFFCRKCIDPYLTSREAKCPNCRFDLRE